ncbi:hypothetical protein Tco_0045244 [Tanacetum coccineum]
MLEKSLYDSWKSRMELYIENWENKRMILNSVQNGPLVWPIVIEENGTTRTKRYEELLLRNSKLTVILKLQTSFFKVFHLMCLVVPVFNQGDDPIACLNKEMAFFTDVASSRFPFNQQSTLYFL